MKRQYPVSIYINAKADGCEWRLLAANDRDRSMDWDEVGSWNFEGKFWTPEDLNRRLALLAAELMETEVAQPATVSAAAIRAAENSAPWAENRAEVVEESDVLKVMAAVCDELDRRGIHADLEYPGFLSLGDEVYGTDCPTWCGDVYASREAWLEGYQPVKTRVSVIPSDSADVKRIADWIESFEGKR